MDSPMLTQPVARKRDARHLDSAFGHHTLATWSTQKVVSQTNAEPECCSMVRCASESIGLVNTIRELGHETHVRIWTDAAAARGLALRSGGTRRKCFYQELRSEKIRGTVNPADLMTKQLDGKCLVMLCDLLSIKRISGRPNLAPKLTVDV